MKAKFKVCATRFLLTISFPRFAPIEQNRQTQPDGEVDLYFEVSHPNEFTGCNNFYAKCCQRILEETTFDIHSFPVRNSQEGMRKNHF